MKNSRKKDLRLIRDELQALNALVIERMQAIQCSLEDLQAALEEQYDNLSERSQEGEAGERIQDDISEVEYIISDVSEFADAIEDDYEVSVFSDIFSSINNLLDKEH